MYKTIDSELNSGTFYSVVINVILILYVVINVAVIALGSENQYGYNFHTWKWIIKTKQTSQRTPRQKIIRI